MDIITQCIRTGQWLFRHRSYLPLLIILPGLFIYAYTDYAVPRVEERVYEWFCIAVGLFGLGIRIWTIGYAPAGTSGRNTREQIAQRLNTEGPYSVVRHPLYLGNFFMWIAVALWIGHVYFFIITVLVFWLYYERIMVAEEAFLRQRFGEQFHQWAKTTPAFFPRSLQVQRSPFNFRWHKVIYQESNGLAALFLLFALLDGIGAQVQHPLHPCPNIPLYLLTALSVLILLIRKIIYKRPPP